MKLIQTPNYSIEKKFWKTTEKIKGIKMHIYFLKSSSKTCKINKSKLQKDITIPLVLLIEKHSHTKMPYYLMGIYTYICLISLHQMDISQIVHKYYVP